VSLYGFVGMKPHMGTDPLGLIELPEGPITTAYNAAASEALNPNNSISERLLFGALGLLTVPDAFAEQALHAFLGTPERLNRNIPAVVRETKAAIAATDTDTKLRHGAAALGAASSVVLDVSVIAGLAKTVATVTVERELAQAGAVAIAPAAPGAGPSVPALPPAPRVVLSGHGGFVPGSGLTAVPEGTSVTTYSRLGGSITDELGNAVELKQVPPGVYSKTYLPGQSMPNYTLSPPTGLKILGEPQTVSVDTPLSQLLKANMGECHFAACTVHPQVPMTVFDVPK
jgi:hypothetical protein